MSLRVKTSAAHGPYIRPNVTYICASAEHGPELLACMSRLSRLQAEKNGSNHRSFARLNYSLRNRVAYAVAVPNVVAGESCSTAQIACRGSRWGCCVVVSFL